MHKYIIHIPARNLVMDKTGELFPVGDARAAQPFDTERDADDEMRSRNMQAVATVAQFREHIAAREK